MDEMEGTKILKVLITGGAGFLGSVLSTVMLGAGFEVTVLDSFMYGNAAIAFLAADKNFDVYNVDCRDMQSVRPYLARADIVIPLAGMVGAPICAQYPIAATLINLQAQIDLIKEVSHEQRIIAPITESVYGKNAEVCTEETPCNPLSLYGKQKREVELVLLEHPNAVSLRLATLFGMSPRPRLDLLVNDFTWRAVHDRAMVVFEGKARRTCLHVIDASRAFIHAIDVPPSIYNVGAVTLSKISLCEAIQRRVPEFAFIEAQYGTDPDARDYVVVDDKFRATGFEHQHTLESGIDELLKGYRALSNTVHGNI